MSRRLPKGDGPPQETARIARAWPVAVARAADQRLADAVLVAGWTGLRWSELRAVRARDFVEVPMPALVVQPAAPEGVEVKTTKSPLFVT